MKRNSILKTTALALLLFALFISCDGSWQVANSSTGSIMESASVTGNYYKVTVYYTDNNTDCVSIPVISIPDLTALSEKYNVEPISNNYEFAGWYLEGSGTQFSGWGETLTEDITLHAGWYLKTSDQVKTAFENGGYYVLKEDITLSDPAITITNDLAVDLNDKTLTAAYSSYTSGATYHFLAIEGATDSQPSLVVENGNLMATRSTSALTSSEHADLISILNSGSVTIKNAALTTEANGDAVYVYSTDETSGGKISINVADTTINLNPASLGLSYGASCGIRINSRDTNASHKYTPEATVNLEGVDILDKGEGTASAMPLDFNYVEKLNVTLKECNLIMKNNHYIRVNNCGVADQNSTIDIADTNITGYEALFIRANCVNIATTVTGGTITCVNQNYGTDSNTDVFAIHDGENCTITVEGATIIMGTAATTFPEAGSSGAIPSTTSLFCVQYNSWATELGGGNKFVFNDCDIQWKNPMKYAYLSSNVVCYEDLYVYGYLDTLKTTGATENTAVLDSATMESLANAVSGYSVFSSDCDENYTVTTDITVDFYVFYLDTII